MSKFLSSLSEKAREGFLRVASNAQQMKVRVAHTQYRRVAAVLLTRADGDVLIVRKPRRGNAWQFPQGGADDGEKLSDAAHRELCEECGDMDIVLNRKAVGVYKYDFPANFDRHDDLVKGANVTFFMADHVDGQVAIDGKEIVDFAWVAPDDAFAYFDAPYATALKAFWVA